jgi:hypothetical protein
MRFTLNTIVLAIAAFMAASPVAAPAPKIAEPDVSYLSPYQQLWKLNTNHINSVLATRSVARMVNLLAASAMQMERRLPAKLIEL